MPLPVNSSGRSRSSGSSGSRWPSSRRATGRGRRPSSPASASPSSGSRTCRSSGQGLPVILLWAPYHPILGHVPGPLSSSTNLLRGPGHRAIGILMDSFPCQAMGILKKYCAQVKQSGGAGAEPAQPPTRTSPKRNQLQFPSDLGVQFH